MSRTYNRETIPFYRENEIKPELLGSSSLNPKPYAVSSPRLHMFGSQLGQKPAIINGEPPIVFTGSEREYGKYLYTVKIPADAKIIEVIHKYGEFASYENTSPLTLVVYEDIGSQTIDVIEVPHNHCTHPTFGFRYTQTEIMRNLYPGQLIEGGTILAKPPTLNEDGDWCYGRNLVMGLFPSEEGIEDGIAISQSTANNFAMYGYGTVEIAFGKSKILLNTHGDNKRFKPWLDIGEIIPPSGLIVAARDYNSTTAPANMSINSLCRINQLDDAKYGIPGAKIVDIKIIKGNPQHSILPTEAEEWIDKYWSKTLAFHQAIVRTHENICKRYGKDYRNGPMWNRYVCNARFALNAKNGAKKETYRDAPLSDTLLQIKYEFIQVPGNGGKYTDRQGGKAVAVRVIPDEDMPVDSTGRRLDAYMDDASTSNRMNTPRQDEIAITACAETCEEMIRKAYLDEGDLDKSWSILGEFFEIISPATFDDMKLITDDRTKREEIEWIITPKDQSPPGMITGIRVAMPPDLPIDWVESLLALKEKFPPLMDYLIITDKMGNKVKTLYPTLIGRLYMMALERAGHTFSATASSKRQPYGIPAKPSKAERSSSPITDSTTRSHDEDTTRGIAAICGPRAVAEAFDRALNPEAHRQECRSIFAAENPSRIENAVPRNRSQLDPTVANQRIIPITGGRISELRNHVMACGGVAFTEGPDTDSID